MTNDEYKEYLGKKVYLLVDTRMLFSTNIDSSKNSNISLTGKLLKETDKNITLENIEEADLKRMLFNRFTNIQDIPQILKKEL